MAEGFNATMRVMFDGLPAIAASLRPRAGLAVRKAALDIEAHAKAAAPVDTGALRNSIQASQVREFNWQVVVGVEYGIYVEYGTRHMAAQPYLIPAVQKVEPGYLAAMARLVDMSAA